MPSILILEDQPDTRALLVERITKAFAKSAVVPVGCLREARSALKTFSPAIAFVDLELPDGHGTEFLRHLTRTLPSCLRVVITVFSDDRHVFPALQAGAQGYLLKDEPAARFEAALTSIINGEPPITPQIARRILGSFASTGSGAPEVTLSPRETETLRLAARGFTLPEISDCMKISVNTVSTYIKSVYRKLEVSTRAEAAIAAQRRGLLS